MNFPTALRKSRYFSKLFENSKLRPIDIYALVCFSCFSIINLSAQSGIHLRSYVWVGDYNFSAHLNFFPFLIDCDVSISDCLASATAPQRTKGRNQSKTYIFWDF